MILSFNTADRYNGTYKPTLDTLIITHDAVLVKLYTEGYSAEDMVDFVSDLIALGQFSLETLNDDLRRARVAAEVDTARPAVEVAPS
ncbi:hypothetical protein MUN82_09990 [Hymenobacter aerilatus]|uniref:Uncharacterized protein n=1 Tax=Hymenobacter aerilatus TaxID=2932251 RepID=A0A8T9T6F8_9BACT|nr:hypothetical protein [Hymenobacter aerilatus]UOR07409.1 hypothetical protein MUN82_09990 [Hymenobacter aerilatus]